MQYPTTALARASILAIEDDALLAEHLESHLAQRGFAVTLRQHACDLAELLAAQPYDLILLDILLPGANGLELLVALRCEHRVPVILMSALGAEQDRIVGFSQGADDYLPKPFSFGELDVRIDAILRRVAYERAQNPPAEGSRDTLELSLDPLRGDVSHAGGWADLTSTEYRILETLLQAPNEVLSKSFLYQQALNRAYSCHDRSLDMHVSHIRRKLQAIGYNAGRLDTVRGAGYVLKRVLP